MKNLLIGLAVVSFSLTAFAGSGLSARQIQMVKDYYASNGTGDGDTFAISPDQLAGPAAADYAKLTRAKNCKSYGYCPEAYAISVGDISTLAVAVSDDGGTYIDVFTERGAKITSCTASESEDMSCN